jgi:hypothetical protein
MKRSIVITRFGLIALLSLSLFTSTAFAGNAPGATPVVVTNTAASPVPVVQKTQFYQATQTVLCSTLLTDFTFDVPSGKTLVVRYLNVFAGSYNPTDTFGVVMYPDGAVNSPLGFAFQPVGGKYSSFEDAWALNQQIQLSATQVVQVKVARESTNYVNGCSATVTISGELL